MKQRAFALVSSLLTAATLAIAGVFGGMAGATGGNPTPNPIQCGLKAGASLDVSIVKDLSGQVTVSVSYINN